jgi:hypothetical protein
MKECIIKACGVTLQQVTQLNISFIGSADKIIVFHAMLPPLSSSHNKHTNPSSLYILTRTLNVPHPSFGHDALVISMTLSTSAASPLTSMLPSVVTMGEERTKTGEEEKTTARLRSESAPAAVTATASEFQPPIQKKGVFVSELTTANTLLISMATLSLSKGMTLLIIIS